MSSGNPVIPFPGRSSSSGSISHSKSNQVKKFLAKKPHGQLPHSQLPLSQSPHSQSAQTAYIVASTTSNSSNGRSSQAYEPIISFHRTELNQILSYYGTMVSKGEWRDYAIDMETDSARFSIFRHASEHALFKIEKIPKLAKKQGAFQIMAADGRILKRGHDLKTVLKLFDKKLELVRS